MTGMIKRKYGDKLNWWRIIDSEFHYIREKELFDGYISEFTIREIKEPLYRKIGDKNLLLADVGYRWIQMYFNDNRKYSVTIMLDDQDRIIQWYIDIIRNIGFTRDKIPFIDDLYLDVIVLPDRSIYVLDQDELDEAYGRGIISKYEYNLAIREKNKLLKKLNRNLDGFFRFTDKVIRRFD